MDVEFPQIEFTIGDENLPFINLNSGNLLSKGLKFI